MLQSSYICTPPKLHQLFDALKNQGYKLLGPTVRSQAIVLDELSSAKDLPRGWTDEQRPGYYRLLPRKDQAYFGYNVGPQSWKKFFFPAREVLWTTDKNLNIQEPPAETEKWACIGMHACDLAALQVLDKVYDRKLEIYKQYHERRKNSFIVAVNCTTCVETCFCASMDTGPDARQGYDLAITEVINEKEHFFVFKVGSAKGEAVCKELSLAKAEEAACKKGEALVDKNRESMKRSVDREGVHALLMKSWNHPSWDKVAKRCVNCTNCTMSCPTCFCTNVDDEVSLDGMSTERVQSWESCFNLSHSYIHGGSVRSSAKARYRQWLTHKFGTWHDQFGVSGCVGCGRCITWCPVGIDVTEELEGLKK